MWSLDIVLFIIFTVIICTQIYFLIKMEISYREIVKAIQKKERLEIEEMKEKRELYGEDIKRASLEIDKEAENFIDCYLKDFSLLE